MNKKRILLSVFLFSSLTTALFSQNSNKWVVYPAYNSVVATEVVGSEVFALSEGSLYSYHQKDNAVIEYTKLSGLSDSDIQLIDHDPKTGSLLIIYKNQNIDIIQDGTIYNIPDFRDKVMQVDKRVSSISIDQGIAYLATAFGALSVDLEAKEILDTYQFNKSLGHFFKAHGHYCFTSEEDGFFICPESSNPNDFSNWKKKAFFRVKKVVTLGDDVFAWARDNRIFRLHATLDFEAIPEGNIGIGKSLDVSDSHLSFLTDKGVYTHKKGESIGKFSEINLPKMNSLSSDKEGEYWVASDNGLNQFIEKKGEIELLETDLRPDASSVKDAYSLEFAHGALYAATGGPFRTFEKPKSYVSIYRDGSWESIVSDEVLNDLGASFHDLLDIQVNPSDPNHFFVSTFSRGIFEFYENKAVRRYTEKNSTLEACFPNHVWASAMEFDSYGSLWTINSLAEKAVHVKDFGKGKPYTPNDNPKWQAFEINGLGEVEDLYPLIITKHGTPNMKWFSSYYNDFTLNVFQDHLDSNGQKKAVSKSLKRLVDQDGKVYTTNHIRSLVEDLNGDIWIGTDTGPMIISAPRSVDDVDGRCYRIKIARNDGTGLADYLLDGVTITDMLVDAGNRKWIASSGSGVYLISDDGEETIAHFTTSNSPLPSDEILSLAYDEQSGMIYIGALGGIVAYQSDAKKGAEDFSNVVVYPNPIRPEYTGAINVTGLMDNSLVKITDVNNNLIYQDRSLGGHLSWDGVNAQGDRIKSGVYFVYGTDSSGKEGVLTKFLVVR